MGTQGVSQCFGCGVVGEGEEDTEDGNFYNRHVTFRVYLLHPEVRSMSESFRMYLLHPDEDLSCSGPACST
jgi:hypothetical protein